MKHAILKFFTALFCMTMCFSFISLAGQDADAKAAYEQLMKKSNETNDGNYYYHMNAAMSDGTEVLYMTMDMNMLFENMTLPSQMKYLSKTVVNFGGQSIPVVTWYDNGYCYTESMGSKIKMPMDLASAMASAKNVSTMMDQSSDLFSDLTLRTEGNKQILSYTMDDTKLDSAFAEIFNTMGLSSMTGANGLTMKIHDVNGEYVLNADGSYDSATINMMMDLSAEGDTLYMNLIGNIDNINPGQPVHIVLPDAGDYQEIPAA